MHCMSNSSSSPVDPFVVQFSFNFTIMPQFFVLPVVPGLLLCSSSNNKPGIKCVETYIYKFENRHSYFKNNSYIERITYKVLTVEPDLKSLFLRKLSIVIFKTFIKLKFKTFGYIS